MSPFISVFKSLMTMELRMPILDLQCVFFFANPPINLKYDEFSVKLRSALHFFELNTSILQFPDEFPDEFPRCQIDSPDKKFNLNISADRCEIRLNIEDDLTKREQFHDTLNITLTHFKEFDVSIIRVGYVTRYAVKHPTPSLQIADKILKIEGENFLPDSLVKFGFRKLINGTNYNDLYQIEAARRRNFSNGEHEPTIIVTHDFNTLFENKKEITENSLDALINNIPTDKVDNYIKDLSNVSS